MSETATITPDVDTSVETSVVEAAVTDGEVFAPVSAEFHDVSEAETEEPTGKTPFLARAALRVASIAQSINQTAESTGSRLAENRTVGEVFSDVKDSASELRKGVSTYAKQEANRQSARAAEFVDKKVENGVIRVKLFGKAALKNIVKVGLSIDAKAGEVADKVVTGLDNTGKKIEQRSKEKKIHKERRKQHKANMEELRQQEAQEAQAARDAAREAQKAAYEKAIADARAQRIEDAKKAAINKAQRQARNKAWRESKIKSAQQGLRVAKSLGGVAFNTGVSLVETTKAAADERKTEYHKSRAKAAKRRLQAHQDKLAKPGETYSIRVNVEDGRSEEEL